MAFKKFALDERTQVTIYKRKASRSLKLSISPDGEIRVSIPVWAPYRTGLSFAKSRSSWIAKQQMTPSTMRNGQPIGKAHHLFFEPGNGLKPTSRTQPGRIIVRYPIIMQPSDEAVQRIAKAAAERALRSQAEQLLPQRLAVIAEEHGFTYRSVSIKKLKSRWGSCDHQQNIALNLYLMQLPWQVIDYVLLHELTHTKYLNHSSDFWTHMEGLLPGYKAIKRELRNFKPAVLVTEPS